MARQTGGPAVVMTFHPPPMALLRPDRVPPALTTLDQKTELIARCGVDCLIRYPTDRSLLQLTPDEFFDRIVMHEVQAHGLVEGPNFFFGHDRAGTVETLQSLGAKANMAVQIVDAVQYEGGVVSSSAIRRCLIAGEIAAANEMLGRPYQLRGRVGQGAQRGRQLGFPTANIESIETLLPDDGVYAGFCTVDSAKFQVAVSIGPNPTFQDDRRKTEVHLIGFEGNLYGQWLTVQLTSRLRNLKTFASRDELVQQLHLDIARASETLDRN